MTEAQSYLAKLAFFLLRNLYPKANREAFRGDLLEQLSEERSNGWLWRQALAAIAIAAFRQLRAILPELSVLAVSVALICAFPWSLILPVEVMDQRNPPEWIPTLLAVEAVTAVLVSPLFAALLIARNAFRWAHLFKIGLLTFLLLSGADTLLRAWALRAPVHQPPRTGFFVQLQVLCIMFALLISTAFARRLSLPCKPANS